MKNNKKGFTLIELLAVIVILAILVMLAIPAVTRYLQSARRNAFSDNALRAIEAVRNDVIENGFSSSSATRTVGSCTNGVCTYDQTAINELLEKKLTTSPYGEQYDCVVVTANQSAGTYSMTMIDKGHNGFKGLTEDKINSSEATIKTNDTSLTCDTSSTPAPSNP